MPTWLFGLLQIRQLVHGVDTEKKKKLLTTGKKLRFTHPYSPHWKKKLKTLEKNFRICTLNLFAAEISYLYNMCSVWALKHAIA